MAKNILIVMAHQDDEVAFSTRISHEIYHGNRITCIYLTDGAGNGNNPQRRDRESLAALHSLGVKEADIHFLGSTNAIPDGNLAAHIQSAYNLLENSVSGTKFHRIYCMAYEGGHHDHDACHMITLKFSAKRHMLNRTWQMPLYNGYRTRKKMFRVLVPIATHKRVFTRRLSFSEAVVHTRIILRYPSQWKTWLGLSPELIYQRLFRRRENLMPVDTRAIANRPHSGLLLYERLFGYTYQQFYTFTEQFSRNLT